MPRVEETGSGFNFMGGCDGEGNGFPFTQHFYVLNWMKNS